MTEQDPTKVGLIAALQAGAQHLEDLKRVAAEFDNYRKRVMRDAENQIARTSAGVVYALLPVVDDLDRALAAVDAGGDVQKLAEGVKLVRDKLHETLASVGVERIPAVDEAFDPNLHDAVMDEGGDGDETVVTEELRPGYRLAETVIRPSMVKVGRR